MSEPVSVPPTPAVFRAVPLTALVAVAFLGLGASTIAFQGHWWFTILLGPLALAWVVVVTRTVVDADGVTVRWPWASTPVPWDRVSTLRVTDRGRVRLVRDGGAETSLPGVRARDLGRLGEASGGRIRVPSAADAAAAAEHARELAAARMRVERHREREAAARPEASDQPAPSGD